jgi:hypothetical protein
LKYLTESILIEKLDHLCLIINNVHEAIGKQATTKLLLRGSRDGMTSQVFHSKCDNKGPLLAIIKTRKDILCGGFSAANWKSSEWSPTWATDKNCFLFSLKLSKIYKR